MIWGQKRGLIYEMEMASHVQRMKILQPSIPSSSSSPGRGHRPSQMCCKSVFTIKNSSLFLEIYEYEELLWSTLISSCVCVSIWWHSFLLGLGPLCALLGFLCSVRRPHSISIPSITFPLPFRLTRPEIKRLLDLLPLCPEKLATIFINPAMPS